MNPLAAILIASLLTATAQLPPMPQAAGTVEESEPLPPITSTLAWDGQADADAFSVTVVGTNYIATNYVTTFTNVTIVTQPGTNRIELRAHKGTLASAPVITNVLVSVDTIVTHWPETSGSVLGPWIRRPFGSVTNPVESVQFVRVGQSKTVQTNRWLR